MHPRFVISAMLSISFVAAVSLASSNAAAKTKHKPALARAPAWSREAPETKYPPSDPYAVWVAGTYVGRDPDPKVRDSLIREFYHNLDNR